MRMPQHWGSGAGLSEGISNSPPPAPSRSAWGCAVGTVGVGWGGGMPSEPDAQWLQERWFQGCTDLGLSPTLCNTEPHLWIGGLKTSHRSRTWQEEWTLVTCPPWGVGTSPPPAPPRCRHRSPLAWPWTRGSAAAGPPSADPGPSPSGQA